MDSFQESKRQIRIALIGIAFILVVGVVGFSYFEKMSLSDAVWLTIITLATIGYGDVFAHTAAGRTFTIFLVLIGLSIFAYGLQAAATFVLSPAIRDMRQNRRIQHLIDQLEHHYIICGVGEMVDRTVRYVLERAETRTRHQHEHIYKPVDRVLDRVLGDDEDGHYVGFRSTLRGIYLSIVRMFKQSRTLLDVVVVITTDAAYANRLRSSGVLVIEGEPTDDQVLERAGIKRAQAIMVMLDDDTETLFAALTARSHNANMYITAAMLEEEIAQKMARAGANSVIAPYDVAGNFLNNATLRPAVNDFFNSILFDHVSLHRVTQLYLKEKSQWVGKRLGQLTLRERYQAGVIGLRLEDGNFLYAPGDDYIVHEYEVMLVVAPVHNISRLQKECYTGTASEGNFSDQRRLPLKPVGCQTSEHIYTLDEAEEAITQMSNHFVICGSGRAAQNAINKLNPERPFVIISSGEDYTKELLSRGFRVVEGSPTQESTLIKAGVERAQAIMVAIDNKADSVLTILVSRALSKRLLITATASSDDMIAKLRRAGADRVVSPFNIAAQFVILATTSPVVNDFLQYVLFNYQVGMETTELYMEEDSPWIGETIESLRLDRLFRAGVLGIRRADGSYIYAPPDNYVIGKLEVLIVTTPMVHSDELRLTAHGSATKRPRTLRRYEELTSGVIDRSTLDALMGDKPDN